MSRGSPRPRRFGAGEVVVVGILAVIALSGGTTGRLFVAALVLLALLTRLAWSVDPAAHRARWTLLGSALAGVGLAALFLGSSEVGAVVVAAFVVDLAVGRWRLAEVHLAASTARHALAGETIGVEVSVRGVRAPVTVTLLDPASRSVRVERDGSGTVPHVAEHRGIYSHLRLDVSSSGWLATVVTRRIVTVELEAPIAVHPRPVPVAVDVDPELADDPVGSLPRPGPGAHEVRSLRPYVPGDPRRRVHWPTTARRGELAVVEVDGEEGRPSVDLVVELPGLPCDLRHEGSHRDHLDAVTGQASYTAARLLAAGVPVVLTTVEDDVHGALRTVTARVRGHAELGHRLAAAREGRPEVPPAGRRWHIGPDVGPARRVSIAEPNEAVVADRHARIDTDAATGADDEPDTWSRSSPEELHPPGDIDAASREVVATAWGGSLAGGLTALALAEAELPGVVLILLTVTAVAAGSLRWRRAVTPRHAATTGMLVVVAATAASGMASSGGLVVAVAVAWALPRLVGMDLLARAATGARPPWWPHVVAVLTVAGMLAAASVPVTAWSGLVTVAVLAGVLVVLADADHRRSPVLDGAARSFMPGTLLARLAVVCAVAVLLQPALAWGAHEAVERLGTDGATVRDGGSPSWLGEQDRLDLTAPRADRDRVVLLVDADLPALLRDGSFERWDGRTWWSGPAEIDRVVDGGRSAVGVRAGAEAGSVKPAVAGVEGIVNRQRITIRAPGALVLPAAAEPIEASAGASVVALDDGSLRVSAPLGRGDVYLVTSRMPSPTPQQLRATSGLPVPDEVRSRFVTDPGLSARATADIRAVAGHLTSVYDQVRALEAWLGDQVAYSLDAPLPPVDVDVVDHFLYDAREGWCQQIATTLTLALRELGVPARLVTGYVAGEWDGRRFVVRERHAHAWVEVFFPGIGWHGFDPTGVVPQAVDADPPAPAGTVEPTLLAAAGAGLALAFVVWRLVGRRGRRRAGDVAGGPPNDPRPWATAADRRIRTLGERCGIVRGPGEGVADHADRLADVLGDDRLRHVARVVVEDAYGPDGVERHERHAAEQVLDEMAVAFAALAPANAIVSDADGPPPPPLPR